MRACCRARVLPVCLIAVSCAGGEPSVRPDEPGWAAALARLDPLFGGGHTLAPRLEKRPFERAGGDGGKRAAFLATARARHDLAAEELVRATLPEASGRQVLAFLGSAAGDAMRRAELIALSGCGEPPDALPEELPVYLSDPARVGENAAPTLVELLGTTRSAYGHALLDAARTLTRAQAGCIGRFLATGVGQDWLAARRAAFPAAQQRFEAFVAAARSRGFLRIAWEDVGIPDGFRD